MDPTNTKALHLRGSTFVKKTFYAEAIKDFDAVLQNDKSEVESLYMRGKHPRPSR